MGTEDTDRGGAGGSPSDLAMWKWASIILVAIGQAAAQLTATGSVANASGGFIGSFVVLFVIARITNNSLSGSVLDNRSFKYVSVVVAAIAVPIAPLVGNAVVVYFISLLCFYPPTAAATWAGDHLLSRSKTSGS